MIRPVKFVPSLIFLVFWLQVVHSGIELKKAESLPIISNQFIHTIAQEIDNPWTQIDALRLFYLRLAATGAPEGVWADSVPYAWVLWSQVQYIGSVDIMLRIAHKTGNLYAERYWGRKYLTVKPDSSQVRRVLKQDLISGLNSAPLELLDKW